MCVTCPAPTRRRRTYKRQPARRRRTTRSYSNPFRKRRATTRKGYARSATRPRLTRFELAQLNPFDRRVIGAKIPDANTQPSDTYYAEDRIVFTYPATDLAIAKGFFPNTTALWTDSVNGTSSAWTWPSMSVSNAAAVSSDAVNNFVLQRPVGHGVRLSCPNAPLSVTGFVHIGIYPLTDFNRSGWDLPVNLSQMSNLSWYRRFTLSSLTQKSVTVVNKFLDLTAQRYSDPASDLMATGGDVSFHTGTGWCAIIIAVEGAQVNTNCLSVESLVHFEAIPKISSTNTGGSSPAANFNVQEMEGVSRMAATSSGVFVEGEEQSVISRGMQALGSGFAAAAGELFDDYVLPTARSAGYAAAYGAAGVAGAYYGRYNRNRGGGIPGINTPRLLA